jgi:hypothetical protein
MAGAPRSTVRISCASRNSGGEKVDTNQPSRSCAGDLQMTRLSWSIASAFLTRSRCLDSGSCR